MWVWRQCVGVEHAVELPTLSSFSLDSFCSERNYDLDPMVPLENDALASALPDFEDLWPTLHHNKDKGGFTFDGTTNTLIDMPRPDSQMRYDRVLWKTGGGVAWRPTSIQLVGTRPVEGTTGFLSDHFGLLASFSKT